MSEPIKFHATASKVTGGGDDVRVVLSLKDSPVDIAAAVSLFGKLKSVFRVAAYVGKQDEPFAEFRATIPELQTGICFNSRGATVVKLDVPATDRLQALQLVGYNDKFLRFEVEDEGEKAKKAKREAKPKKPKGPYSYFWKYIHNTGFLTYPRVSAMLEAIRMTPDEDPWEDLLHRLFGVETLAFTSPDEVLDKFQKSQEVERLVERAKNFQQEKEGKVCQQSQQ